jgi:hypothetical protein
VCSGFPKRSCPIKELKRDDDLTKSHRALEYDPNPQGGSAKACPALARVQRGMPSSLKLAYLRLS